MFRSRLITSALLGTSFFLFSGISANSQSFSCRLGEQPACLNFGETVCSSLGKCVVSDAQCFDQFQCNFEGFTCQSNVTECVDEYDRLRAEFNILVDEYNNLANKSRAMSAEIEVLNEIRIQYDDLVDRHNDLLNESRAINENLELTRRCIFSASDLIEAQSCMQ